MNAAELLSKCKSKRIDLKLVNGQLRYKAPKGVMNESFKKCLKEHKQDLIQIIASHYKEKHIQTEKYCERLKCSQCKYLVEFPCKNLEHITEQSFRQCQLKDSGRFPMQLACENFVARYFH